MANLSVKKQAELKAAAQGPEERIQDVDLTVVPG